ncbi:LysR family transcriptional regulator [Rhodoblastus acidophilus]|uniref:LysR family transcriptional regulator n=1 Tax=Candidatus Rhodoblastus alkanivorans TaxID=2954117 RepID=A0ABS9Z7P9_9HYPH|nr:LysR family transcriptional regulator [Candidatus Rhodoblastus alkanivorans]MCI4683684.1 LysR family transcriptional regulator [Candidatus Rhodoblastus alkanivorans]MDI4641001.1 LysR family transcriptional regulator [Rhodoblastus acidophilus]
MTLDQLRIFVAVAELEHVTRAARQLNLTQSAVSAAIGALEQRHDMKLFDRIGRRVALTQEGRIFLVEARALLIASQRTEKVLTDIGSLKTGRLNIAASQTTGNYWLPPRLARFAENYPGVGVHLTIGNTHEVAELAAGGEIDLGLVEGAVSDPLLTVTRIYDDELLVVAAPALAEPFCGAQGAEIYDSAWIDAPWVAREKGSGTREAFEEAIQSLAPIERTRRIVLELPSNEAVRAAVEAGAGLAVMSSLVARASIKAGALVQLPFALPKRPFYVLSHRQLYTSRAAKAMLALMLDAEPANS